MYGYFAGTKWPFTRDRVPLNSRVTLGSRVSLILCITQLVFHAREGALRWKGFLTLKVGKPYMVGTYVLVKIKSRASPSG